MSKIQKMMEISKKPVDVAIDIELINKYSLKPLAIEDVFAFPVVLCGNEIDRDNELITDKSLEKLVPLFLGKTGVFDHSRSAKNQIARLYNVYTENETGKNSLGGQKKVLKGYAYIVRDEKTADIITKIEGGILKEVSVSFAVKNCVCSICGESIYWWSCENGHEKGREYEGKKCYGILEDPTDAYEFSFVAVPAQKDAGVKKDYLDNDIKKALEILSTADLDDNQEEIKKIVLRYEKSAMDIEERKKRKTILQENKKFIRSK